MPSIRNSRTRLIGAAATVVLAALSLSACGDDGKGARDEGTGTDSTTTTSVAAAKPAASAPSTPSASADPKAPASTPTPSTRSTPAEAPASAETPASGGKAVTCDGSTTKTVASAVKRPLNHLLLTVTNAGGKPCFLYYYPSLQFTDAQSEPPVIEDSQPQAVVTLNPGESGYASVILSAADGSGKHGRTVKSLNVFFRGRSATDTVGQAAHPPLPANGIHIDDSLTTTYWQQSMSDALTW